MIPEEEKKGEREDRDGEKGGGKEGDCDFLSVERVTPSSADLCPRRSQFSKFEPY